MAMDDIDIVIITALAEEGVAVEKIEQDFYDINWETNCDSQIGVVRIGVLKTDSSHLLKIMLASAANEGSSVAPVINHINDTYHPSMLTMCGVCAGDPERTHLCDVIVADSVYSLDSGKKENGEFLPEINTSPVYKKLNQVVNDFVVHARIDQLPTQPEVIEMMQQQNTMPGGSFNVHIGPVACGEQIADYDAFWENVARRGKYKTIGYEMEGNHLGYASQWGQIPYLFFKGVMDFASGKTDGCKKIAERTAADALLAFLKSKQFGIFFGSLPKKKSYKKTVDDFNVLLEKLTADAWDEYKNALVTGRDTSKRDKILNDYKKRVADIGNNCPSTIPAATRIFPYMNYYGYLYLDCLMRPNHRLCPHMLAGDPYADLIESLLGDDNATIGLQDVLTLHNRSRTDFMVASELIHSSDE